MAVALAAAVCRQCAKASGAVTCADRKDECAAALYEVGRKASDYITVNRVKNPAAYVRVMIANALPACTRSRVYRVPGIAAGAEMSDEARKRARPKRLSADTVPAGEPLAVGARVYSRAVASCSRRPRPLFLPLG